MLTHSLSALCFKHALHV